MKFKLLLMAAACIGMVACSKDDAANPSADGSKQIVLKVNLPTTRAALTPDAPYEADRTSIESMNVFFTNANGVVQNAYELTTDNGYLTDITSTNGLRFVGLKDVTAVYIVANAPDGVVMPDEGDNMNTFSVELAKQAPSMGQDQMVFAGCDLDITPLTPDVNDDIPTYNNAQWNEGDQTYNADITIRPLISRIEWGKIETDTDGTKLVQVGSDYYLVEWSDWDVEICGIYQSNVYGAESIFAATPVDNGTFFATPTAMNAIFNGEWTPATTITGWDALKPVLTYNGYDNGYASVLPADYNDKVDQDGQCVPFHFFVPFDVDGENPAAGTLADANEPHWHFLLHFEDPSAYNSSITVYNSNASGDKIGDPINLNSNDPALSVASQFMFPVTEDNIAYVNVIDLFEGDTTTNISYAPGKIYTTNVLLSPFNVTAGPVVVTDYNVIVKVKVADFATQAVTPEFDKN